MKSPVDNKTEQPSNDTGLPVCPIINTALAPFLYNTYQTRVKMNFGKCRSRYLNRLPWPLLLLCSTILVLCRYVLACIVDKGGMCGNVWTLHFRSVARAVGEVSCMCLQARGIKEWTIGVSDNSPLLFHVLCSVLSKMLA